MARSTGIGLPITRTDINGAKVAISTVRRTDLGSPTTRTATRQAKPPSAMENTKVLVSPIMRTGTSDPVEPIRKHVGKSYDGKKEGPFYNYEEDGKTMWLIITYKRGGSRAKPDEYPLGVCDVCGEVRRLAVDGYLSEVRC